VPAITATRDLGPRQHVQGGNTDELSLDTTSQHEVGGGEDLDVCEVHALRIVVHGRLLRAPASISVDTPSCAPRTAEASFFTTSPAAVVCTMATGRSSPVLPADARRDL
jgi:hypothetical protein